MFRVFSIDIALTMLTETIFITISFIQWSNAEHAELYGSMMYVL